MNRRTLIGLLAVAWTASPSVAHLPPPPIEGVWEAQSYHLAAGDIHSVRGRIFFTKSEWLVVFFVMDGEQAKRGSAEGGNYVLAGDRLTFQHHYLLAAGDAMAGLPATPLRMEAREGVGPSEPTRIELTERRLVLHFPSGNSMRFTRTS